MPERLDSTPGCSSRLSSLAMQTLEDSGDSSVSNTATQETWAEF